MPLRALSTPLHVLSTEGSDKLDYWVYIDHLHVFMLSAPYTAWDGCHSNNNLLYSL